jgi:benzoyl-CoA reductase/2-hydroxyglutaryl-CoA dehydratase subunit BcrC/BadD/HgdB
MTALEELTAAYADPRPLIGDFKAAGGQVVGYIGADVPEELIAAAGFLPVRLRAETGASDAPADRYGEGGGNAVIRGYIARLLDGTYDYVDHLVVATTPSYLGALFTFLREIQAADPSFPRLSLQLCDLHHGATPATQRYNLESLARLKAALERWSGRPVTDPPLSAAIADANASRVQLGQLQALRVRGRVSGVDALQIIGAAYVTPKDWHAERLAKVLRELATAPEQPGRPVVFSGSETDTADLYRRLEAAGLNVVGDDQGWGGRVTERLVANGDPLAVLEARYRKMAPAPAKSTTAARVEYLLDLVRRTGAQAVVFAARGLDHPAAWDIPEQIKALDAAGVPSVVLDPAVFTGAALGDLRSPQNALGTQAHG